MSNGYGRSRGGGRGGPRDNTVPSNYVAIPVKRVQRTARAVSRDRVTDEQENVQLALAMTAVDPLHMGSGVVNESNGVVFLDVAATQEGVLCAPGSGVKGAIRQIHEVLTDSCEVWGPERPDEMISASASLFGMMGVQGRVAFEEFFADEDADFAAQQLPTPYPPSRKKGRRFYGAAPQDAKLDTYYGVLTPGSVLHGGLLVEHASRIELGTLFLAMGLDRSFCPRIGGGKHGGLGRVQFDIKEVKCLTPDRYRGKDSVLEGDIGQWAAGLLGEAKDALSPSGRKALEKLRKQMGGNR